MKKNLFFIILSILVLCGCGNKAKPEQPIVPTITEQTITPTATKKLEQPTISPTEEPVTTPTEVPTATPVLPTEVPEQKPKEKFAYMPEQLVGNWLLISNMIEGDITNVIPGYFESLIFQSGYYDNSDFSLTASMEAADTYGIVEEAFYEYSVEVLEEPLYLNPLVLGICVLL
jgi:hypothetical protein